jgi:hypothetical protein
MITGHANCFLLLSYAYTDAYSYDHTPPTHTPPHYASHTPFLSAKPKLHRVNEHGEAAFHYLYVLTKNAN